MDARQGQHAIELACGCDQTTLVIDHHADDWQCGKCRRKGAPTGRTVVLHRRGALPADWQEQPIDDSQVAGEQMEGPYSARFPSVQSGRHPGERPLTGNLPIAEGIAS